MALKQKLDNRINRDELVLSLKTNKEKASHQTTQEKITSLQLIKNDRALALRNEQFIGRATPNRKGGRQYKADCDLEWGSNRKEITVDIDERMHVVQDYGTENEAYKKEYTCDNLDETAGKIMVCTNPMQAQRYKYWLWKEKVEQCKYIMDLVNRLANKDMGQWDDEEGGKREIHFINYSINNRRAKKAMKHRESGRWDDVPFHQPVKKFRKQKVGKGNDVRIHQPAE